MQPAAGESTADRREAPYRAHRAAIETRLATAATAPPRDLPGLYLAVAREALDALAEEPREPVLLNYAGLGLHELGARETRIVVSGNYRAWRHFVAMRASEHADVEIRRLAIACLRQLTDVAPAVFADFEISELADGTEVATSPLATEA